jgi:RNase P subunit RPR2
MCKKCKKVVEMKIQITSEFGYDTTYYTCPECGNIEKSQINRVHYGNDEIKK